ncbi:unnamed protein product, partial [Citrullus colocynthis]
LEEELLKHKKSGECSKEKEVDEEKDDIDSSRGAKEEKVVEEKDEDKVNACEKDEDLVNVCKEDEARRSANLKKIK